jgi:Acetyltransferase (GNAT) domain
LRSPTDVLSSTLTILAYDPSRRDTWDAFLRSSKNGTFLFLRDYMEYHGDRFEDASRIVLRGSKVLALFPANRAGEVVCSHAGLTYGGLITDATMTVPVMLEVFTELVRSLRESGARKLLYKTIPYIYHDFPAEEDRYALFMADARLWRRDVLAVVPRGRSAGLQERRNRGARKASSLGLRIEASTDWAKFWPILIANLKSRHQTAPVHTIDEVRQLSERFPDNIHLHLARGQDELLAGAVIYESANVAHLQYIASTEDGRKCGALDLLLLDLLHSAYAAKAYFDFGISNELDGRVLNRGLIDQKEGFGARAVAHDFYEVTLDC